MNTDQSSTTTSPRAPTEWDFAHNVWIEFAENHPELSLNPGTWGLTNFLRNAKVDLLKADAIRKARAGHWIANRKRFDATAFDLLTTRGNACLRDSWKHY